VKTYGDKINEQFLNLTQLDTDIRNIVTINKEIQAQDEEFERLIKSGAPLTPSSTKKESSDAIICLIDAILFARSMYFSVYHF